MTPDDDVRTLVREALDAHFGPPPPGLHQRVLASVLAGAEGQGEGRRPHSPVARRTWAVARWPLGAVAVVAVLLLVTAFLAAPRLLSRAGSPGAAVPTTAPTAPPVPTPTPYPLSAQNAVLGDTSPGPNAPLASATSDGYVVSVTGAVDDGATIALQFAVSSAGSPAPVGSGPLVPSVTDSRGQSLLWTNLLRTDSPSESVGAIGSAEWFDVERAPDGAASGSPISLHITQLQILSTPAAVRSGNWSMTVTPTLSSDPTTALPLPAPGKLGAATITFTSVRANHAYLQIGYEVNGVPCPETEAKGCGIEPTITGPGGVPVSSGPGGLPSRLAGVDGLSDTPPFIGAGVQMTLVQLTSASGTYTITIPGDPGQSLTRTVSVPYGRAPSVPVLH